MAKKAIVECNPDEILALTLGLRKKEVVHQNSKGEVCNYHAKSDVNVAIIDQDPGSAQPNYLKNFVLEEEKYETKKLINKKSGKIIIIICPRLEEWIIRQCNISKVNPALFFLPGEAKQLKVVINLKLKRFNELLQELKRKDNNGLKYLQSVLENCYK